MNSSSDLLVPAGARLVHIGPHKTGSTAIQVALHEVRDSLPDHGVCYPGPGTRARKAGWSLGLPGRPAGTAKPPIRHWRRMVKDVREAGSLRVCVSNEDFGRADEATAARIVEDLGGPAVHVVAVARRLDRYLPSQWQERVKAGESSSFEAWLEVVLGDDASKWNHRNTWQAHHVQSMVRRWTDLVGPDRFTLIVSDDSDRLLIPRTFEAMLGLPEGLLKLHPDRSNRSLTYEEVELIRAINIASKERGWDRSVFRSFVKFGVSAELTGRPPTGVGTKAPPLPAWALDRVRELSAERARAVREMDVRVIGDPDWLLLPDSVTPGGASAEPVLPVSVAAAAVEATMAAAMRREARYSSAQPEEAEDAEPADESSPLGNLWSRLRG